MNKWFLSSSGSGDLSTTIKGLLTSLIPLIIITLKYFNYDTNHDEVESIIIAITTMISAMQIVYGIARKIALAIKKNG